MKKNAYKFTTAEKEAVLKSIDDFATLNDFSRQNFEWLLPKRNRNNNGGKEVGEGKRAKKGAWKDILGASVPHRPYKSAYAMAVRLIDDSHRLGCWSEADSEKLLRLVEQLGKKWTVIGDEIGRSPDSCKSHYRSLEDMITKKAGKWSKEEEEQLTRIIVEDVLTAEQRHLYEKVLDHRFDTALSLQLDPNWTQIAEKMKTRGDKQCHDKLMRGLTYSVVHTGRWEQGNDALLLERLRLCGCQEEDGVAWESLLGGDGDGAVTFARWRELCHLIPGRASKTMYELIKDITKL